MNSALVRRDPVMLHDPLRTHTRATIVGIILAMVGLLGFLIFGILKPNAKPPDGLGIVIGKESGQIYVYVEKPEKLIPTFNLASARLILMGQKQKDAGAQGGGGQEQDIAEVVQPTIVPDDRLEEIPRGRLQGIPGADVQIPGPKQRISNDWAVCHNLPLDETLEEGPRLKQAEERQETAVLAGLPASKLGKAMAGNEAVYIKTLNNKRYLIYRPAEDVNEREAIVRAEIPEGEPGKVITEALRLSDKTPRPMSLGLLNSIRKVDSLVPPEPPERGQPSNQVELVVGERAPIGQVFVANPTANAQYFVVLKNGKQRISQGAAELIRLSYSPTPDILQVSPDRLPQINDAPEAELLKLDDYPATTPTVVDMDAYPTTCLGWTVKDGDERTTLYIGKTGLPFPMRNGQPMRIEVGKANEEDIALSYFYMPPGRGAAVHAATSKAAFSSGPIQLISDRGLRYGIPDVTVAKGLGLDPLQPAPAEIVKLLPTGTSLNIQDAEATYDSFEPPPGTGDFNGQGVPPAQGAGG